MKKLIASVLAFSPLSLLAAPLQNINQVASRATQIGNLVIQLAIALAVVWIVVAVVRYLIAGGEEDRKKGRDAIVYGVIGLFIIFSIWGLVFILTRSFSTVNATPTQEINKIGTLPPPPQVETGGGGSFNSNTSIYTGNPQAGTDDCLYAASQGGSCN